MSWKQRIARLWQPGRPRQVAIAATVALALAGATGAYLIVTGGGGGDAPCGGGTSPAFCLHLPRQNMRVSPGDLENATRLRGPRR